MSENAGYKKNVPMYYGLVLLGLILHIIFEVVFIYIKNIPMSYYNFFSIAIYTYVILNIKKNQFKMLFISCLEAMIFFIIATIYMGWEYNFQSWLIALVVLSLANPFPNRKPFYILAIAMAFSYLILYFYVKFDFNISRMGFLDVFFSLTNIVGLFILIFFAEKELKWSDIMQTFFLKSEVDKMRSIVGTDELTGLVSRHKMNIILDDMNKFVGLDTIDMFYIAFADLDDFKRVNDTYGHDIGDKVLILIANILKQEFRNEDIVARWGGEEFLILIKNDRGNREGIDNVKVSSILNRVRSKIEKMNIEYKGEKIYITMTFGAVSSKEYKDIYEMINAADAKMYEGKSTGKNKVVI